MKTIQVFLVCCALAGAAAGQAPSPPAPPVPPAALVDVSTHLIKAVVERPVCRMAPVRDLIIDAEVFGMGETRGVVQARTMTDANRAWIDFVFMGATLSRSVGVLHPARVYTETLTTFELHQPITIDGKNLRTWTPLAWVRAQVTPRCITDYRGDPESGIVDMARFEFYEDKYQIETVVARKAEAKLKADFALDFLPEIEKAAKSLGTAWKTLNWLGVPTQPACWSSTEKSVRLQTGQLIAGLSAPPAAPGSADVTLRVHQSVLREVAQKHLAGKTFGPFDLAEMHHKILTLFGGAAGKTAKADLQSIDQLLKSLGVAPASITFVGHDPISFQFADGGLTLTLHGKSFKVGNEEHPARDVVARYRIEQTKELVLVRDGPVKILSAGPYGDLEPAKEKEVEAVLLQNFNLYLPQRMRLPHLNLGIRDLVLAPSQAELRNGWLLLAWTREGKGR